MRWRKRVNNKMRQQGPRRTNQRPSQPSQSCPGGRFTSISLFRVRPRCVRVPCWSLTVEGEFRRLMICAGPWPAGPSNAIWVALPSSNGMLSAVKLRCVPMYGRLERAWPGNARPSRQVMALRGVRVRPLSLRFRVSKADCAQAGCEIALYCLISRQGVCHGHAWHGGGR